ncbi:MAG: DUF4924 domain-containing protein [Bacteroidetes bacterium HGW-Bacteroidetes-12]|jgi:flagellin-specific chaperone FliS|nr:MAG: DUF4924 domain-containing protein [Bacteroidetes bacterium HGW-Bacteroidetes-12]
MLLSGDDLIVEIYILKTPITMLIAQEKEKTNIAEYILYMWQIEDLVRFNAFDLDQIYDTIISKFTVTDDVKAEMKLWYKNIVEQMLKQGISEKGHLDYVNTRIEELNNLHNSLLTTLQDKDYQNQYIKTSENIESLMQKANNEAKNEVHACLIGLYGFLVLKLKNEQIGEATKEAINSFSGLLAILTNRYNKLQKGELTFSSEINN